MIPDDLTQFLESGRQLTYDTESSIVGAITLKALDDLSHSIIRVFPGCQSITDDPYESLDGTYHIGVVDLIAASNKYSPEGMFCWIPSLKTLASIDSEHGDVIAFPNVSWSMVVRNPLEYLEAQWGVSRAGKRLFPWLHFPYVAEDFDIQLSPYPDSCELHNSSIRKRRNNRHPLFEVIRDTDPEGWFAVARDQFPYAGVPASERKMHSCKQCSKAEYLWVAKMFDEIPSATVKANAAGFVKCPNCETHFYAGDQDVFLDGMHSCGQKINVLSHDAGKT
ncbi:hypothetical protein [Roseiconus lacunae]|uniref:Uncharacterized protein n=1 Tax=Roseiconus lacunae TaxID=2605694 RepID=A0ABT7PSP8_9BACT|nr:hypothetical protein [Roseiconus lacunae]MDM4019529.1 hypothetical protein [Roseiconus lacunae]